MFRCIKFSLKYVDDLRLDPGTAADIEDSRSKSH